MRGRIGVICGLFTLVLPLSAAADDFAAGSLIIPMDTDYQDMGMLRAYGLVYELLRQGVPVRWVIKPGKQIGDEDFTASATDLLSGAEIDAHGYRGGPWVIDASDADAALSVIEAWQTDNPETAVHEATAEFSGDVSRVLVVAPTIAMMADGNQKIARKYMVAAGIPDSVGDPNWPDASPDMLDPDEISGPNVVDDHTDGALFDEEGDPVYCQFMSMHWAVNDAVQNPEVVAEMRAFLQNPTHLFAECQAVNAFENLVPHGFFLTNKGFLFAKQPDEYDFYQQDTPFAQLDGEFQSVGGSEPAYTLPPGEMYKADDIVMITEAGTPVGVNDVWMTGFIDGLCPGLQDDPHGPISAACLTAGKVSYLGGHEYDVDLPISASPTTQGTRLFLNSLFEAPCATAEGLPAILLSKTAPDVVVDPEITFDIAYMNSGALPALDAVLTDTLPPGVTFVSATDNGVEAGGVVTWQLGNLGEDEGGMVSVTVALDGPGVYANTAVLDYRAGVNNLFFESNQTMTAYGVEPGTGGQESSGGATGSSMSDPGSGSGGENGSGGESGDVPTSGGGGSGVDTSAGEGGASDESGDTAGETVPGGCSCSSESSGAAGALALLTVLGLRRRRRGDAR